MSSTKYLRKIFRKTNISNPLISTRTSAYQGDRNVTFAENFAYVLNGWPLPSIKMYGKIDFWLFVLEKLAGFFS